MHERKIDFFNNYFFDSLHFSTRLQYRQDYLENATDETVYEFLRLIFKGTNLVQLGIDVAFDIVYSLGLILLSAAFLRHSRFGVVLGIYGIVTGGLLLAFNMATFPVPPAEAGLIDFGPFTGLFWLVLIIGGFISGRRARDAPAGS